MSNWKIIKDYPNYAISDKGEVKSLPRKSEKGTRVKERILKHDVSPSGYHRVSLCDGKNVKRFLVHRLVAEAFIPNPLNKPHINHKDNNPYNNTVNNLEWVSHSENMVHAEKQGRLKISQMKGGQVSAEIQQKKAEQYFTYSMGSRFIATKVINKRRYVYFICPSCNTETHCRADLLKNPATKECTKCVRKQAGHKVWATLRKQDEDIV